jgi:hypothetical protein
VLNRSLACLCLFVALLWAVAPVRLDSQPSAARVRVHVTEAGGMRRSNFPVMARIPFPQGVLGDPANARLLLGDAEVPVQMTATEKWRDGSVQWLEADFNASPGPGESLIYALEHGPGVKAASIARGLTVTSEETAIQIGNMRFNRRPSPLLASVKYRDEAIREGKNGVFVTDAAGREHDLASADALSVQVTRTGPLVVRLHYTGMLRLEGNASAPFVLDVEMPSSKSWVKVAAVVSDPGRQVRRLALHTPLALGPLPWVWDLGTPRWTYGVLRAPTDAMAFEHIDGRTGDRWAVTTTANGRSQEYEVSRPADATFAGWGHVQGGREVVAFAIAPPPAAVPGTSRVSANGAGLTTFEFAPAAPQTTHTLTVYQHYVSSPVQIGAATSPAAILSPLRAVADRDQYVRSGVAPPAGAPASAGPR